MTNRLMNLMQPQMFDPLGIDRQIAETQAIEGRNRLADLAFGDHQRGIERESGIQQAWKTGGGDLAKVSQNLMSGGYGNEGMAVQKSMQEQQKGQADIDQKTFDMATKRINWTKQNLAEMIPDPNVSYQAIIGRLATGLQAGILDERSVQAMMKGIPQSNDPRVLRDWLQRSLAGTMSAEQQFMAMQPKTEFKDTGGSLVGIQMNPSMPGYGMPVDGTTLTKTQTPESVASMNSAAESRAQSERHFRVTSGQRERELMQGGKAPAGFRWRADGTQEFIPGGPADPNMKAAGPATEDERKAAGWYDQANQAWKNMQKVMYDKRDPTKFDKEVTQPGPIENIAASLGFEQSANAMRPEKRQQFVQAASALAEPLLRAATGAGMNADEARQKVLELTPQLTDKEAVIKQKIDAIPGFLGSLKSRAGRALPNGGAQQAASAPASSSGWSIVERK